MKAGISATLWAKVKDDWQVVSRMSAEIPTQMRNLKNSQMDFRIYIETLCRITKSNLKNTKNINDKLLSPLSPSWALAAG